MKCVDVQKKFSELFDRQLSADEAGSCMEHLRTCDECSGKYEDLKKTVSLARELEEVTPPAGFSQKVMEGVRKEAGEGGGIIRKLFYPFHIKVPLEAFATIAVVLVAVYVFKALQPDMVVTDAPVDRVASVPESKVQPGKQDDLRSLQEKRQNVPGAEEQLQTERSDIDAPKPSARAGQPSREADRLLVPEPAYRQRDAKLKKESAPEEEMAYFKDLETKMVITVYVKSLEGVTAAIEKILLDRQGRDILTRHLEKQVIFFSRFQALKTQGLVEDLGRIGYIEDAPHGDSFAGALEIRVRTKP